MSDDIDRAQESDAQDRDRAMASTLQRIADAHSPRNTSIDGICIDCDEPIEPARLAALDHKTSRCASCAADHEHRLKGYRR
ncbi:TraR/DksA family transcriptional regulator [Rhodanobacter denitrificans]|uniref:DnaK suppressor protein n=1 Tax=Rhodanobacter denitrificans TaxID=666685 RepID=M4NII7_9GAMM|nr:TraR/DksA C4-type zinc finger protein [Rhodanobacter denitrificans]AGG89912.1 DnaK suppressor protein [Rhodanobacter denitrificans]UJM85309.1 TraR/DksA C4-type zinc finger protein [Rhodanobacter denitrificans]